MSVFEVQSSLPQTSPHDTQKRNEDNNLLISCRDKLRSNTTKHHQTISTARKVTKRMRDLALAIMTILGGIGNNVMIRPCYVIATTLKPEYVETKHESTF